MKHLMKVLVTVLLVLTVLALAGCGAEKDQYAQNNEGGYTVSVQYHANGGQFATNTYTITDSYKAAGKTELMLLEPGDPARSEPQTAERSGYFLAGWYTECTETGEKDKNGNPICTYSGYWDFATDTLPIEAGKSYSAEEPVLHLYAAWVPNFTYAFYDLESGELIESVPINPLNPKELELELSTWDQNTGRVNKKDIPVVSGYTFNALYLDEAGTQKVEEASIQHSGALDLETAVATGDVMNLYVDYMEGSFTAVYTAQDLFDGLSAGKDLMIMEDLDFTDVQWDSFVWAYPYGGKLMGNGHTLSNITVNIAPENVNGQEYLYAGLFGKLEETAVIQDVTLKNLQINVQEGTLGFGDYENDIAIGILAGETAEGATTTNVTFEGCTAQIDVTIENYDYTFRTMEGVTVTLTGEGSDKLTTEITDGIVKIIEIPEEENEEESEV